MPPRLLVLALLAFAMSALGVQPASAIEAKCSACEAVANELQAALERERPRNHLDMRGRIDSKGVRYGKLIDYKISELRFVELLEDLCTDVGNNFQIFDADAPKKRWRTFAKKLKIKGARAKAMRAEISGYCHRLVEEQEEALQAKLYANELNATNVDEILCVELSKECSGVEKLQSRSAAAEVADEASGATASPKKGSGKKGSGKGSSGKKKSKGAAAAAAGESKDDL